MKKILEYVNVTGVSNGKKTKYVITDMDGNIINRDIPYLTLRNAVEKDRALALTKFPNGNISWRTVKAGTQVETSETQVETSETQVETSAETEMVAAVNKMSVSDTDVRAVIKNAIRLKPDTLMLPELQWKSAIWGAIRGENILFMGNAGSGKTLTARSLAKSLNRPFFKFNMGAMTDARSSLIGNTHFSPKNGTFFAGSEFVKAITTPNAVILLDEYSRISHDAENIMITVLDRDQRYMRIDESPDVPTINVAHGVIFMATANVGNEYTATRTLDRATMDRFGCVVELPLLTEQQEIDLAKMLFPNVNVNYINAFANIATYSRVNVNSDSPELSTLISTRALHQQCRLAYDGFIYSEVMELSIVNMYSNEGGVDSERAHIRQKIQQWSNLDSESPVNGIEVVEVGVAKKSDVDGELFDESDIL